MAADPHKLPRDDDSWGKLASDLFGINLSADDLDLSDIEPPPPPVAPAPHAAPPQPVAAASKVDEIDLADMDFDADDADFDDDEEDEDEIAAPPAAAPITASSMSDDDDDEEDDDDDDEEASTESQPDGGDDFWDALESWDWEASETANAGSSAGESSRDRPRSDRGPRGRDRGGRGGDRRDDRGSRPPRRDNDRPPRERTSEARPVGERQERKPEPRTDRPPRREEPPRRQPPREPRAADVSDEFGDGLVESSGALPAAGWDDDLPAPPRSERPRIVEDAEIDERDDMPDDVGEETVSRRPEDESGRPRRRRRRRRRGSSDREAPAARTEDSDEFAPAEIEGDEPAEDALEDRPPAREREESADRGPRRGRRRRGRGGRGGERPAPADAAPSRESASAEMDFGPDDADESFEEEAPVVAVTYENIPTWEEAISYLLKPAGDGRRDGGGGGYRGGPRRR